MLPSDMIQGARIIDNDCTAAWKKIEYPAMLVCGVGVAILGVACIYTAAPIGATICCLAMGGIATLIALCDLFKKRQLPETIFQAIFGAALVVTGALILKGIALAGLIAYFGSGGVIGIMVGGALITLIALRTLQKMKVADNRSKTIKSDLTALRMNVGLPQGPPISAEGPNETLIFNNIYLGNNLDSAQLYSEGHRFMRAIALGDEGLRLIPLGETCLDRLRNRFRNRPKGLKEHYVNTCEGGVSQNELRDMFEIIDEAIATKEPLLLFSHDGGALSAALLIAYLEDRCQVTHDEAIRFVRAKRYIPLPEGNLQRLTLYVKD